MTLTLHLAKGTVAMSVHAALEETGLDHDLAWVDFASGEQTRAPYHDVNPKGRVPALTIDGTVLTEVPALLEWIAQAAGSDLLPTDPMAAARVREMMSYLASTAHVNHAHRFRGSRWADSESAIAEMRGKVAETMTATAAYLETRLTGDWVVEAFSVADLHLWNITHWMPGDRVDLSAFPRLSAHHDRVANRAAVARVIAMHSED